MRRNKRMVFVLLGMAGLLMVAVALQQVFAQGTTPTSEQVSPGKLRIVELHVPGCT
jgi:hypothetical protein